MLPSSLPSPRPVETTGTDLSDMTGMDRAAISRLENGQLGNPTISTMNRCAEALGKRVVASLVDAPNVQQQAK